MPAHSSYTYASVLARCCAIALVAMALALAAPSSAAAVTASLQPTGDLGLGSGWSGCGESNLARCLDDPTPHAAPSDVDQVTANNGATTVADFTLTNLPLAGTNITQVQFRLRGQCPSAATFATTTLQLHDNVGTAITPAVAIGLDSTMTSYAPAAVTPLSTIDETVLDGAFVRVTSAACTFGFARLYAALAVDVVGTFPPPPTVTGNARDTTGAAWGPCDGITPNVGVVVDGTAPTYVPCDDLTGAYASLAPFSANQMVTAFLNDNAAGRDGATYRRPSASSATPVTMDLDEGRVRLESGTTITNALIAVNDATDDADIPLTATAGSITVGGLLNLRNGVDFTPGGAVTAPRFASAVGSSFTPGASMLVLTGSGTASCATPLTARPWCHGGSMAGQPSVRYTGTGTTAIAGGVYDTLLLQPASGSPTYQLGTSDGNSFIITTAMTIGDGTNTVTADTSSLSSINDLGPFTVATGATLGGAGNSYVKVGGSLTGGGAVNLTGGTVDVRGSGNATLAATGAGSPWQFATLTVSNTSGLARDITIPGTSREIRASTLLQLGYASDSANTTLVANAMTQPITVTGNVDITTRGSFTMPPSVVVHGSIVHSGAVTPGTSTLTLAGAGVTTLTTTGSGSIYDLTVATPGKVVEVASAGIWISHLLTLTGTCAAPVTLRSSVPATSRSMTTTTMTTSTSFARIRDISTTTAITMAGTEDQGGNANLTFTPPACTAPSAPFTHATDASTGSTRPTFIDGATAFHMSVANAMGTAADRVRTTVSSSPLDPSVRGLYALDGGSLADRSSLGATMTNNGGTDLTNTRAGFGDVATFDGINDFLSTPANPAYQTNEFTIETWFRATTLPSVQGILASRASGSFTTQQHASVVIQSTGHIHGYMTNTAGAAATVSALAAPYLDGGWHHVAMTVDAAKVVTLYVDGAVAQTNTYTGTGNGAISAGWHFGGSNHFSSYYTGGIDDPQFTNRALTGPEIAGYYATNRPHAETIWTTPGVDGQTISCADGARCADVAYAGPNIDRAGARYHATHQLRAAASGFWSAPTTDWFETSDPPVSGIARDTTGAAWGPCDGVTTNIGVIVNGGAPTYVPCDDMTGAFGANVAFTAGQTVTTFLNDDAAGQDGATYRRPTVGSATASTTLDIDERRIRLLAGSFSNAQVGINSRTLDADIPLTNSTGDIRYYELLQLDTGATLAPVGLQRTTGVRMRIEAGATFAGGDLWLSGGGVGCAAALSAQPLCVDGTFVGGSGDTTLTGTGIVDVPGLAYGGLRVQNGTFRMGSGTPSLTVARSLSVNVATMDFGTYDPSITVRDLVPDNSGTMSGGTSGIVVTGGFYGSGPVNMPNQTIRMRGSADANLTLTSSTVRIGTLELSTSAGARTITRPSPSESMDVTNLLVGRTGDAGVTTFDARFLRYTWDALTVLGQLTIADRGAFLAPHTTIVQGNVHNGNLVDPGTGTIRFNGAGTSTITADAGASGGFYRLEVVGARTVELGVDVQVTNSLSMVGTSCAAPARVRSTTPGVQRTISNVTPTATITNTIFRDTAMATPVVATSAGDGGNNANIGWGIGSCTAPATIHANATDAQAGTVQPTLDARNGVHMSFRNMTGLPADRYRSVIRSSPVSGTVAGTFPLDGDGADTSAAANAATPPSGPSTPAWVPGGANFGQAASFDGVDDRLDAPAIASYDTTTFTVEAWFRATSIANAATPTIVNRGTSATDQQFGIWFDRASGKLVAGTSGSGTAYTTSTPAGTWLDDSWHHVALAYTPGTLRLYLDGTQYGSTAATFTGPYPASPIRIGAASYGDSHFAGMVDDVQFTRATLNATELTGYVRTSRPHGQAIWTSPSYASSNGDAMPTCTTGTRCIDVTNGGANLHVDGARYWAYHQVRTDEGLWSVAGADFFQAGDSLSVSNPSTLTLPAMTAGDDTTASFSATMGCSTPSGCTMLAASPSETNAMAHATSAASIPRITPASPAAPGPWADDDPLGMGITVLSSTSGKNAGTWGAGANFSSLAALRFVGPTRTPVAIATRGTNGTETTSVGVRVNPPPATPAGSYTGRLSLIAVANL